MYNEKKMKKKDYTVYHTVYCCSSVCSVTFSMPQSAGMPPVGVHDLGIVHVFHSLLAQFAHNVAPGRPSTSVPEKGWNRLAVNKRMQLR